MAKAAPMLPIGSDSPISAPRLGPALVEMLTAKRLFPSPLNPRRTAASPEKERELEDSIVAEGLLQPIMARPAPKPGGADREIIHGSRRHSAISRAIAGGRLPADYAIPTVIREAADEEVIVLAGIENLEREDMHPLDEAELFKALRPYVKPAKGERAEALIARKLHIGERTVFRRLALLKCAPEVQEALRKGEIQLQHAQSFALGAAKQQRDLLSEIRRNQKQGWRKLTADDIRESILHDQVAVKNAAFDLALYAGEIIEDPESGERYFADTAQFLKLQMRAAAERVEALKKTWPWVHLLKEPHLSHSYREVKKGDKNAGAIVFLDNAGLLLADECVITPENAGKRDGIRWGGSTGSGTSKRTKKQVEKRCLTDGQSIAVKCAKSQAMRLGLMANGKVALALACLALIDRDSEVNLTESHSYQHRRQENQFNATVAERDLRNERLERAKLPAGERGSKREAAIFRKLLTLETKALLELFAALLAPRVGSWFGYDNRIGDSPLAIAIAEAVGAAEILQTTWKPTEEHFAAHGRDALGRLFTLVPAISEGDHTRHGKMKKGELIKLLAKQPAATWTPDKFIECRFLTDADMKKAFAEVSAMPPKKSKPAKAKNAKTAKAAKAKPSKPKKKAA